MTTRTIRHASTDRDDSDRQTADVPDLDVEDTDQDANTWGKTLTDEEFAQALRRVLRTQGAGATR